MQSVTEQPPLSLCACSLDVSERLKKAHEVTHRHAIAMGFTMLRARTSAAPRLGSELSRNVS